MIETRDDIMQISKDIIYKNLNRNDAISVQLLLDCSAMPDVITAIQDHGTQVQVDIFKISRTWCYSVNRDWMKMIYNLKK